MLIPLDAAMLPLELPSLDREELLTKLVGTPQAAGSMLGASGCNRYHYGVMDYIDYCYRAHAPVVISPDLIWQVLLAEVAAIVAADPEKHRALFTFSDEKQTIAEFGVPTEGGVPDWINSIIAALKMLVPIDTRMFLPEFSTTTLIHRVCRYATFMDACSPYYNYFMKMCGLPAVKIEGTAEDWKAACLAWQQIWSHMPDESAYFRRTHRILGDILEQVSGSAPVFPDWWKKMFMYERCGSGGETLVRGWFADLYRKAPEVPFAYNFPNSIGKIEFHDLPSDTDYQASFGVVGSTLDEDGCRRSSWGFALAPRGKPGPTKPGGGNRL